MFGCARIDRMEENGKWPWLEDGLSGKQMWMCSLEWSCNCWSYERYQKHFIGLIWLFQIITSISCCWRTRATWCIVPNVLQTKVDAQWDKLVNELSWHCLRRLTFSSYIASYLSKVVNFNLPHMHLAPPLWVTPIWVLPRSLSLENYRVPGLSCGIVCVILRFAISVEHQLVTRRHTTMTYRASMASHGKMCWLSNDHED